MAALQRKAGVLSSTDPGWRLPREGQAALWMVLQAAQATSEVSSRF